MYIHTYIHMCLDVEKTSAPGPGGTIIIIILIIILIIRAWAGLEARLENKISTRG